jgi:hypothetical protein
MSSSIACDLIEHEVPDMHVRPGAHREKPEAEDIFSFD